VSISQRRVDDAPGHLAPLDPDSVERAIRDLVGIGLAHIDGGLVKPTAAALRFIEIIEDGG